MSKSLQRFFLNFYYKWVIKLGRRDGLRILRSFLIISMGVEREQ